MSTSHSKAASDGVRQLRNELERYKSENQDLREEKSQLTQEYLYTKDQISELLVSIETLQKQWGGQQRLIEDKVEQGILSQQEKLQQTVQQQAQIIHKLRNEKVLLSKNIWDLSERLKQTRQELFLTHKQLFICTQNARQDEGDDLSGSQKAMKQLPMTRSNQIVNFQSQNGQDQSYEDPEGIMEEQPNMNLPDFQPKLKEKRKGAPRPNLGVAKSLAVGRTNFNIAGVSNNKFNWLFNEEDSPIDPNHQRYDVKTKMVQQQKYIDPSDEQMTAVGSGMQGHGNQAQNLQETIQSFREDPDDLLLRGKSAQQTELQINRESLVGKSIQGVKNILRKARETDLTGFASRLSLNNLNRPNSRIIDHKNVELDFEIANSSRNNDNPLDDSYD